MGDWKCSFCSNMCQNYLYFGLHWTWNWSNNCLKQKVITIIIIIIITDFEIIKKGFKGFWAKDCLILIWNFLWKCSLLCLWNCWFLFLIFCSNFFDSALLGSYFSFFELFFKIFSLFLVWRGKDSCFACFRFIRISVCGVRKVC